MLWYLISEVTIFLLYFLLFRRRMIRLLCSKKFWYKIVPVLALPAYVWDAISVQFGVWEYNGEYLLGTFPFGFPFVEDTIFYILVTMSIILVYQKITRIEVT